MSNLTTLDQRIGILIDTDIDYCGGLNPQHFIAGLTILINLICWIGSTSMLVTELSETVALAWKVVVILVVSVAWGIIVR